VSAWSGGLAVCQVGGGKQRTQAVPAPVDSMRNDQAGLDVHHLDEIGLIARWRGPRIFPCELAAVRKEIAGAVPVGERAGEFAEANCEEIADRRVAFEDAGAEFRQHDEDRRGFETGVGRVEGHQGADVAGGDRGVPVGVDVAGLGFGGVGGCHVGPCSV
jgi:hypothetical protein